MDLPLAGEACCSSHGMPRARCSEFANVSGPAGLFLTHKQKKKSSWPTTKLTRQLPATPTTSNSQLTANRTRITASRPTAGLHFPEWTKEKFCDMEASVLR